MSFKREVALRAPSTDEHEPVSVFNDVDTFNSALRMAQTLAKSSLVPKSFQGKPEDCLIALEYARRLDVAPFVIMPHLFVVYGTPSISAQMMIALVNRSGAFSRIAWEEGQDGTVVYPDVKGKSVEVPNYYAFAYFTELGTNTKIVSSRVDVKMAYANGWLTKGHDKGAVSMWEKIPQTMLRYRSASMLIKTTCPELMFGMEVAEDARDNLESSDLPQSTVETIENDGKSKEVEQFASREDAINRIVVGIEATTTLDELNAIANDVAHADFTEEEIEKLRAAYLNKKNALTASQSAEN